MRSRPLYLTESQITMAEALPHMIWTARPDGVVDYVSEELERYTGMVGLNYEQGEWLLVAHPDDREDVLAVWSDCIARGVDYKVEFRILHKDSGEYRWHYVAARAHRDAAGQIVAWFGTTVDIHSGKLADLIIKSTEARLQRHIDVQVLETKVLDLISAGEPLQKIYALITTTVDRMFQGARSSIALLQNGLMRMASAPGFPADFPAVLGDMVVGENAGSCGAAAFRKCMVIVTDVMTDPIWQSQRELAKQYGIRACWSVPVLGNNGEVLAVFAVQYSKVQAPSKDELGFVERIVQFLRVAIERTRQHEQLRRSEERFRLVARVTTDVVWECDLRTDRIWYSEGLRTLLGHDPDKDPNLQTGTGSSVYTHPDDRDRVQALIAEAIRHRQFWQVRYRCMRKDGNYAHVVSQAYVVRDPDGRAVRLIGSLKDVTEQMSLEEQLQRFQRLEAVGQMTGGLAHDFNNSLTVVIGSAERLLDELSHDDPLRRHAEMILKASTHGAEVTSSLLAFARKQPLKPVSVDLADVVSSMRNLLVTTLGERIELTIDAHPWLWRAMIDVAQFESALLNLCLNARDAMHEGGLLHVRLYNQTMGTQHTGRLHDLRPGDYVALQVKDSGCGMDAATLSRVFEPFFTTKDVGKGSGLGLSMVYGFVKQSNGHIDVQSVLGKGTEITIYFPKVEHEVGDICNETNAGLKLNGAREHILLVEDDDLVREHVESLLLNLGYRVTAVPNAAKCLSMLDQLEPVDLLFSDIVMPGGVSGTDLAREIRKKLPELPILLTSGYSEDIFSGLSSDLSEVKLLKKPYRRHDLASALKTIFST